MLLGKIFWPQAGFEPNLRGANFPSVFFTCLSFSKVSVRFRFGSSFLTLLYMLIVRCLADLFSHFSLHMISKSTDNKSKTNFRIHLFSKHKKSCRSLIVLVGKINLEVIEFRKSPCTIYKCKGDKKISSHFFNFKH
jgi:hypothetical protein